MRRPTDGSASRFHKPARVIQLGVAACALVVTWTSAPTTAQTQIPSVAMTPAQLTHHMTNANGIRLHYVRAGSGPAVILLHGWPTTWAEWRPIIPALVEAGYTVIAPDLRGLGRTERPLTGYNSRTVAEDIRQLVRGLGLNQIYVVAHDIGVSPAYAYAAAYPQEVRRLALLDAIPNGVQPPGGGGGGQGKYWHMSFHGTAPDLAEALVTGRERTYLAHFFRTYAANPTAVSDADIDEFAEAYRQPGALRAGFEYYKVMEADGEANKRLARTPLPMPVLALGGETVGAGGVLAAMRTVAPQAQGGVIPGAGHWLMHEKPDEVARRLIAFFREDRR